MCHNRFSITSSESTSPAVATFVGSVGTVNNSPELYMSSLRAVFKFTHPARTRDSGIKSDRDFNSAWAFGGWISRGLLHLKHNLSFLSSVWARTSQASVKVAFVWKVHTARVAHTLKKFVDLRHRNVALCRLETTEHLDSSANKQTNKQN